MASLTKKLRQWYLGDAEEVAYRLSHVFTYKRPFPLLKLLLDYSGHEAFRVPHNVDPFYVYRDQIDSELRNQLEDLAILEACYKFHDRIPQRSSHEYPFPKFKLEVRQSQIRGAGKGVFLHGSAKRGQVIAMYPGLSYFSVRQGTIDQYGLNLRWPRGARDYILSLERSIWIDGNPRLQSTTNAMRNNIWARGHLINHPSLSHTSPNVLPVLFDFGPDFIDDSSKEFKRVLNEKKVNLEKFVCAEFAWEFAAAESEYIPNGVFVALRDIEDGEEIFYDYEWEYNIKHIYYATDDDIEYDWPWYQSVPQSHINGLIEPFMTETQFNTMAYNDYRVNKIKNPKFIKPVIPQPLHLSPNMNEKKKQENTSDNDNNDGDKKTKDAKQLEIERIDKEIDELVERVRVGDNDNAGGLNTRDYNINDDSTKEQMLKAESDRKNLETIDLKGKKPMRGSHPKFGELQGSLWDRFAQWLEIEMTAWERRLVPDARKWRDVDDKKKANWQEAGKTTQEMMYQKPIPKHIENEENQEELSSSSSSSSEKIKSVSELDPNYMRGRNKINLKNIPHSSWSTYDTPHTTMDDNAKKMREQLLEREKDGTISGKTIKETMANVFATKRMKQERQEIEEQKQIRNRIRNEKIAATEKKINQMENTSNNKKSRENDIDISTLMQGFENIDINKQSTREKHLQQKYQTSKQPKPRVTSRKAK